MSGRLTSIVVAVTVALAVVAIQIQAVQARAPHLPSVIITSANVNSRIVALTFDDGPSPYTPQVLSILHQYHVPATFFVVGIHVRQYPNYVHDEVTDGNIVGNHTYTHADLQDLSSPYVTAELTETQGAVRAAAHYTPHWFRPPYGDVDSRIVGLAGSVGLHTVTWSVDPADWSLPGVAAIEDRVLYYTQPGSIVLMHDGGGDRSETVAALPYIIQTLKSRGYRFATLDQLFRLSPMPACVPTAAKQFHRAGIQAKKSSPIFRKWSALLCVGTNLGPATSKVYQLSRGVLAQNFAKTAHRIQWDEKAKKARVRIMWSWAAAVFSKDGVKPLYGHAITRAWFSQYLKGYNWGPALAQPKRKGKVTEQRFEYALAIENSSKAVVFHHHPRESK
jgi:peptidoglycan/xylan/chitin deacetylase (PgdA/CDA1 family)